MLSGFPSNARNTKTLYDKKMITKEEASHILMFTHFSNPLFILSTLAIFFLHNKKLGIIILLSHYLSNIIIGIILRPKNNFKDLSYQDIKKRESSFGLILLRLLKTLLIVCY